MLLCGLWQSKVLKVVCKSINVSKEIRICQLHHCWSVTYLKYVHTFFLSNHTGQRIPLDSNAPLVQIVDQKFSAYYDIFDTFATFMKMRARSILHYQREVVKIWIFVFSLKQLCPQNWEAIEVSIKILGRLLDLQDFSHQHVIHTNF